jgi:hypothetical protein
MTTHYPLSNPLIRFLDKMPESWTRMDMIRVIEEKSIEKLTFHYTDWTENRRNCVCRYWIAAGRKEF